MDGKKPSFTLSSDDDLGELPTLSKEEETQRKACSLDDGPCESCQ